MNKLVKQLKENDQDFEFYPTTTEIVKIVQKEINKTFNYNYSILDIGAGNGNFFKVLESLYTEKNNIQKYAIEKSNILLNELESDIFVVGTDFNQQTLIDKKVDIIFCNPPYSEYELWAEKIIKEANCKYIYLVIPERWKNNKSILSIIEQRHLKYEIIGSTDFIESEFRQARAKVDIIKFKSKYADSHYSREEFPVDPFDIWFDSFFDIKANKKEYNYNKEKEKQVEIKNNLIKGQNLIERLEELYNKDFEKLLDNYRAIEKLDPEIFQELDININGIKAGLKLKIEGLKNLYWHELFDNLETITNRLTKDSRKKLLDKLTSHTSIDFTSSNVYAVVIWAIKNVNFCINDQLKQVYLWMSDKENVINYKSNERLITDKWRYNQVKDFSHYSLDYRLIFKCYSNFNSSSFGEYDYPKGLHTDTHSRINDIITIAKNLGFNVDQSSYNFQWASGKAIEFTYNDEIFMEVRAYKNGNIHCKMNQKFIKKLNIEAGRLNGWIKSPEEASQEMNIDIKEVLDFYNTNLQIVAKNVLLLS